MCYIFLCNAGHFIFPYSVACINEFDLHRDTKKNIPIGAECEGVLEHAL